jgi:hypothetical protein
MLSLQEFVPYKHQCIAVEAIRCNSARQELGLNACYEISPRKQKIWQTLGCHCQDCLDFSPSWTLQKERTNDRKKT